MTIKDIVFHLDTSETAQSVCDFAVSLAAATGAHLTAVGVAIEYLSYSSGFDGGAGLGYLMEITDGSRKTVEDSYARLTATTPANVQTDFVMIQAPAAIASNRFGALARHFDLTVVGQGTPESGYDDRLMIEGALFGSGRPVFIVPFVHKGPAKLGKAMVCWDGGVAASRALASALPLLARAGSVEVVSIIRKDEPADELPGFNISRHLTRHGIKANLHELPYADDAGDACCRTPRKVAPTIW